MEKTEMMCMYEQESGLLAIKKVVLESMYDEYEHDTIYVLTNDYVQWLEAKSAAYDRLMIGGEKTLKEWANIFRMPVAIQPLLRNHVAVFANVPYIDMDNPTRWTGQWMYTIRLNTEFEGDWTTSLTLPDEREDV